MTERPVSRASFGGFALALALGSIPVACGDLVDPDSGFGLRAVLNAPDTIPLGTGTTAILELFDDAGRRVAGIPVRWSVEDSPDGLIILRSDTLSSPTEFGLTAVRTGQAVVKVETVGGPTGGPVAATRTIWSVASGVRVTPVETPGEVVLQLGQDSTLRADVLAADGRPVPEGGRVGWRVIQDVENPWGGAVQWSEPSYSTVRLRAKELGTAMVIAVADACTGACEDTLSVRITQTPNSITIGLIDRLGFIGQYRELNASVTDTRGNPVNGAPIEWSLANTADTVTIELRGDVVFARANGTARVVARSGELADTATVEVWQDIAHLQVVGPTLRELVPGTTDSVVVEAYDFGDNGGALVTRPFDLAVTSSDPAVVEAVGAGDRVAISGRAPGSANIGIQGERAFAQFRVLVNPPLDELDLRLDRDTLRHVTDTTTAEAWGRVGTEWFRLEAAFRSSDGAVAFAQDDGVVVALGSGTAWIRAHAGGLADSAQITVRQTVERLELHPPSPFVALGGTIPFRTLGFDAASYPVTSFPVSFTSDAPSVLDVDATGTATAHTLGRATVTAASGPVRAYATATIIPGVGRASLGVDHGCFIVHGGALYCFGNNSDGQLGDGTRTPREVPAPSASPLAFDQIATGASFTCGIATDGATYCWGANSVGSLGNGTTAGSTVPVRVTGDPGLVHLSAAGAHVCGLTHGGTAYCWGENDRGQAGVGPTSDHVTVPTPVAGLHTYRALAAGPDGACAVTQNGDAHCWGHLGSAIAAVPVRISSTTAFRSISGLGCAIAEDGTLHCRFDLEMVPVQDGRAYRSIAAGSDFHCALGLDDYTYCFGTNGSGQLGTGDYKYRLAPTRTLLEAPVTYVTGGWTSACAGTGEGLVCWGNLYTGYSFLFSPVPQPLVHP